MSEQLNEFLPFHQVILRRMWKELVEWSGYVFIPSSSVRDVIAGLIGNNISVLGSLFERATMSESVRLEVLAELRKMRDFRGSSGCQLSAVLLDYFGMLIQALEARNSHESSEGGDSHV